MKKNPYIRTRKLFPDRSFDIRIYSQGYGGPRKSHIVKSGTPMDAAKEYGLHVYGGIRPEGSGIWRGESEEGIFWIYEILENPLSRSETLNVRREAAVHRQNIRTRKLFPDRSFDIRIYSQGYGGPRKSHIVKSGTPMDAAKEYGLHVYGGIRPEGSGIWRGESEEGIFWIYEILENPLSRSETLNVRREAAVHRSDPGNARESRVLSGHGERNDRYSG